MPVRRTLVVAVVALAAAAGVPVGVALHRVTDASPAPTSSGTHTPALTTQPDAPTTGPPSATDTVTAAPAASRVMSPTSSSSAARSTSASLAPLGVGNLLVANDYVDAGWSPVSIRTAAEGMGQATISVCQLETPNEEIGIRAVFSGVAERDSGGGNQYVKQFRTATDARRSFDHVDGWRTSCPQNEVAAKPVTWVAGPVHQVRLDGEAEGQWWTLRITSDGHTFFELVANVRVGARTSVVDAYYGAGDIAPDGATLVRRSAARLV